MPVSISGVKLNLWFFPSSVVGATVSLFGAYEMTDIDACLRSLAGPEQVVLLDIGANCGLYSLLAACSRPKVRVVAIEPDPDARRLLRRNVDENAERIRANGSGVEIVAVALGAAAGEARFLRSWDQAFGSFFGVAGRLKDTIVVPTRRGDELLAERGVDEIDCCKIDVEGGELVVLQGLEQTFRCGKIRFLQIELNRTLSRVAGYSCADLVGLLENYGYAMTPDSRHKYENQPRECDNFHFIRREASPT